MSALGSVSILLADLRGGDRKALTALVKRYWNLFVKIARSPIPCGTVDAYGIAEDVTQEALLDFVQLLERGRADRLAHRDEFLALMSTIVCRTALNRIEREGRLRRGDGWTKVDWLFEQVANQHETDPAEEAALNDTYRAFIEALPDEDSLRAIAEMRLAGATQGEIASNLGVSTRTIERKWERIRLIWQELARSEIERQADTGDS
jgi:RNA polymerase sigma factor (sigma-70 family)